MNSLPPIVADLWSVIPQWTNREAFATKSKFWFLIVNEQLYVCMHAYPRNNIMWENVSWMLRVLVIDTHDGFKPSQVLKMHHGHPTIGKTSQPSCFSHCYDVLIAVEAWLLSAFNYCVCAAEMRNELVLKSESISDTLLDPSQWPSPRGVPQEDTRGETVYWLSLVGS